MRKLSKGLKAKGSVILHADYEAEQIHANCSKVSFQRILLFVYQQRGMTRKLITSYAITGNQSELRSVLQKHGSGSLLRVNARSIYDLREQEHWIPLVIIALVAACTLNYP